MKTMNENERKYVADGLRTLASILEHGEFDDYQLDVQNGIQDVMKPEDLFPEPTLTGEKLMRLMIYARPKDPFKPQFDPYAEPLSECQHWLRNHDRPFPKTCPTCGLTGPCKFGTALENGK